MKTAVLLLAALLLPVSANARPQKPNQKDRATLVRLYEEEVLAHGLYVALGKLYPDVMPLRNIPRAEARHREIMAGVLEEYGIPLPKPPKGKRFATKGLDKIYKQWLADGRKSEVDACRAGVRLEDHDIAELREAQKQFPRVKQQLANLESASGNHLRAFHRNMTSRGGTYKAEALSPKDIEKILAAPHGGGHGRQGQCGNGQAGGQGKGRGQGCGQGCRQGQSNQTSETQGRGRQRHGRRGR